MIKNKPNKKQKKLWGGRFREGTSGIAEVLSSSIAYDSRLYKQDIAGSIAHAKMLNRIGILSVKELKDIERGLKKIKKEIDEGSFQFDESLEDIHMNIESRLTSLIGDAGRKLHTARSRNDQVALDVRLYIRDETEIIKGLLKELIAATTALAEEHIDVIMPGYTHLQVAQTVRLSHHLLAYSAALMRDFNRLDFVLGQSNILPLGVGALAGVNYKNDRNFLKKELGFSDITQNSMDTVSNRDFVLDFLYFASVLGMHLSRFCEELVLWSTSEFNFIKLSDRVTTGSSIMPQKKNPDIAELIRGKCGRLYGNLVSLLTTLKGLPMTYNRDLQEDKEPLFDSIDTVKLSIRGMTLMLSTVEVNTDRMREAVYSNFITATDIADYLAKKGVPFRESHEIVGKIVQYAEDRNIDFFKIDIDTLKSFSSSFNADVLKVLNPETSTERKESVGGTSKKEIKKQLNYVTRFLRDN